MVKAIILDIGGVMYKEDTNYPRLCKQLGLDLKKFMILWHKYRVSSSTGKMSPKKYMAAMANGLKVSPKKLHEAWRYIKIDEMRKIPRMETLVKNLKKKGYIVGSLTNIMGVHHKMRLEIGAYNHFHFNICSCEVGLRKPDKRIYTLLLKRLKLPPKEIVFIDDYEVCLKPARKLGIKTIRFKNYKRLIRNLKKFGVKI